MSEQAQVQQTSQCKGKQGYSELSQGWEKSYFWATNSWLPEIIAYNMVSCYTEFVLTVTKGGNLQWKHDITAKETLTTYWTSFDKWLMDFRGWLHVLPNIACTSYCSSLHFYERRSVLHWGEGGEGAILINPVWHKLYREVCKEIFYPYFEPRRERFIE